MVGAQTPTNCLSDLVVNGMRKTYRWPSKHQSIRYNSGTHLFDDTSVSKEQWKNQNLWSLTYL